PSAIVSPICTCGRVGRRDPKEPSTRRARGIAAPRLGVGMKALAIRGYKAPMEMMELPRRSRPTIPLEGNMSMQAQSHPGSRITWRNAPTKRIDVGGTKFVYRQLGPDTGVPVIFLNHLAAELDRWDPRVVDGIATRRRVIVFDNQGIGASEGKTPTSVEAMARDAVAFIRALGFAQVDLLGFSLGGFISQVIAQEEPQLVRKIILAGTGPAGGPGIDKVTSLTIRDMVKGVLTFRHPEYYLFFTETPNGRKAAREFLARLKERTENRDKPVWIAAFNAQLKAIHAWGRQRPTDLSRIHHPALVANGDHARMVPSSHSRDLARRLPPAALALQTYAAPSPFGRTRDAASASTPGAGLRWKSITPSASSVRYRTRTSPCGEVTSHASPSGRIAWQKARAQCGRFSGLDTKRKTLDRLASIVMACVSAFITHLLCCRVARRPAS